MALWLTASAVLAAVVLAVLAASVWRRHGSSAGLALALLLLAVGWWNVAYAVELASDDLARRLLWGDLKYLGIAVLPAAWLVFVLHHTGRGRLVTRRLLVLLTIEPAILWVVLALPATHDLVRYYPPSEVDERIPVAATGPVFWVNLLYSNVLLVLGTVLLVGTALKLARTYRLRAIALVLAALLPWAANLLHNLGVGVFRLVDLTPIAFVVTGGVLVLGLYRARPRGLSSVAWHQLVHTLDQGVLLTDPFGRVVDANPAARAMLQRPGASLVGSRMAELLVGGGAEVTGNVQVSTGAATVVAGHGQRHVDVTRQPLFDGTGGPEGELVLLRDVTDQTERQRHLEHLLAEQTRITAELESSLRPALLPHIPGVELASRYQPAGDTGEVGGDFFDVFALDATRWGIVLGDVSGKGAPAASVTGMIRYMLRAYATAEATPATVLARLNQALLRTLPDERFCTLVYAVMEVGACGVQVRLCLAGHHPPLLRRADGSVAPAGRLGTALGMLERPDLLDVDLALAPGDLLCLFTDGLVEARRGEELFGTTRATEVVQGCRTPGRVVARLATAAEGFQRGALPDDLAILALSCSLPDAPPRDRRSSPDDVESPDTHS